MELNKFDHALMATAEIWAGLSKGKIKVGSVIAQDNRIIAHGYNGLVSGLSNTLENTAGSTKPDVIHAEENALIFCARKGIACEGASLYVTHRPCGHCSALIAQAGIKAVYYSIPHTSRTKGCGTEVLIHKNIPLIQVPFLK